MGGGGGLFSEKVASLTSDTAKAHHLLNIFQKKKTFYLNMQNEE